jgi:hypothetical protein
VTTSPPPLHSFAWGIAPCVNRTRQNDIQSAVEVAAKPAPVQGRSLDISSSYVYSFDRKGFVL